MKTAEGEPAGTVGLGELLSPVRRRLGMAIALRALAAALAVVPFAAVAELARVLLAEGPADRGRAWTVTAVAAGALLAWLLLTAVAGTLAHNADLDLQLSVRRRLVDRLGRVPLGWFTDRGAGGIGKAVQHDVDAMHHLVAHSLLDLTAVVVTALVTLGYLFWVDWRMALILLVPLVVGIALFARRITSMTAEMAAYDRALQRIIGSVVEFVEGIAVVKMFGQAKRAHRRYARAADDFAEFLDAWLSRSYRAGAASAVVLSPVTILLAVLVGGTALVSAGHLDAVDLLPFVILGLGLAAPLQAMDFHGEDIETANTAAKRVGALLAAPELAVPAEPRSPDLGGGPRVGMSGVEFGYDADRPVLSGIDLVLEPGTVTALVGASGSGKTTLAKLLPRFFDPTAGSVAIGGVDVREIAPDRLYRLVSFVLQDVQLLDASVRDNIRLARPDADDETVRRAARAAAIDDRVRALPRGYDSVVGRDVRFSGGEAQRLSIARAILAETPIVVLDEATAHADPEAEASIQDALSELAAGRTVLVVAHRLASVAGADRIVVLDRGRIAEQGTHAELLAAGGRYARMWRLQNPTHENDAYAGIGAGEEGER
ncbi:ABC transporter ATP-binding protein [Actinomadura livida]|uniref:ABC transporter ATP-binding protein n=1 Tax=Actinomadura livida TaxID=79909 RepID=A0A7W7MW74_9ACTN|nr:MULTISPECIES: ABC transporter ATP-binding protein [Actinomadura]MBB4772565.1 ATP-binding cassette subfamily B protein [Actinomadura catellatispora]GGU22145.1 ABC transporter ATP-binding protein [Actinomadura livida]